jgi:hypothetical protein
MSSCAGNKENAEFAIEDDDDVDLSGRDAEIGKKQNGYT